MTQDKVIEMARQASTTPWCYMPTTLAELKAFAKLVAQHEREACAKLCEDFADTDSGPDGITPDYHSYLIRQRGQE